MTEIGFLKDVEIIAIDDKTWPYDRPALIMVKNKETGKVFTFKEVKSDE